MSNLKTLVQKNFDGESLTDTEYAKVAKYWEDFSKLVEVCPQVVGKGCQQYVMNKAGETAIALKRRRERNPVYNVAVSVSGPYHCRFSFTNRDALVKWLTSEFPKLKEKYGNTLEYNTQMLDGLQVGDKCHVYGDGDEEYTIVSQFMYSNDRPGFTLNTGFNEEVAKCYAVKGSVA